MKTTIAIIVLAIGGLFLSSESYGSEMNPKNPAYPRYSNGYLVHGSFEILFTSAEYTCYGFVAAGSFQSHTCRYCKRTYYTQSFRDKEGNYYTMYSNAYCSESPSGYVDGLKLGDIYPCACNSDVFIKE